MITVNPIAAVLAAPLGPDWTIERLAEDLLDRIAVQPEGDIIEYVLNAENVEDRQSQRLLRPLLACLATMSVHSAGESASDLYGGDLLFERFSPQGSVWIIGQFKNRPGETKIAFRRSSPRTRLTESNSARPMGQTETASKT